MPQFRFRGQNASLLCKYELEPNEELFSLKWYKEDTEFYRYTLPRSSSSKSHQVEQRGRGEWRNHHQQQVGDGSMMMGGSSRHMGGPPQPSPQEMGHVQSWRVPGIKIDVSSVYYILVKTWRFRVF